MKNRRKQIRTNTVESAQMESWMSDHSGPIQIKDISHMGARIYSFENLKARLGDYITIQSEEVKNTSKQYGEIRWMKSSDEGVEMGVEFHSYEEIVKRLTHEIL
jgi:hypothetical protein